MKDTIIQCPNCKAEIPVSEVLGSQIRDQLEADLQQKHLQQLQRAVTDAEAKAQENLGLELKDLKEQIAEKVGKVQEAEARELELRKKTRTLEEAQQQIEQQVRAQVSEQLKQESEAQLNAALTEIRQETEGQMKHLEQQLAGQKKRTEQAQAAELALRNEKSELEQRARELDLEVARKVDDEKKQIEQAIRKTAAEEQSLKLREKEKQIDDLRKALEDAKRRSELGSQELQGEVLELDIQVTLERQYPHDRIEPVPKGMRGADIIQHVHNGQQQSCGTIIWETKNTKNWSLGWIDKLKDDQRSIGAGIAVLVSVALPQEIDGFGHIEGVWVVTISSWPALASVLREQLIQVAFAHTASEGKQEKMDLLYRYLAGDQFRHKVQGIVEAFTALQEQLLRERRAMERQWKEREKQIERVITNTVGMYGEMSGILGGTLPSIPALELDGGLLESDGE